MATYYVGSGGNDANSGNSWGNRKLTLNGAEDIPVAAGDTVYVGPGTYREALTVDVSGTGGSPITYIADQTGANTDGIGGMVRITGSNDDATATRSNCITATSRDYRTFRGFTFDGGSGALINLATSCSNWIIEDCWFNSPISSASGAINVGGSGTGNTIRRCWFLLQRYAGIVFTHSSTVSDAGHTVENCVILGCGTYGIQIDRVGGNTTPCTIKNCVIAGAGSAGVRVLTALAASQTWNVNNSIICSNNTNLRATVTGEITENYNTIVGSLTADRTNVSTGANSVAHSPLFQPPLMLNNGRVEPWLPLALMAASTLRNRAGTGVPTEDIWGTPRAQETDSDWGAVEALAPISRETSTVRTGSNAYKVNGRGYIDFRIRVVSGVAFTASAYVRWDNNASIGSKPQMLLLADYGVTQQTDTATGDGTTWEELSVGGTPNATGLMTVRIVNRSTHSSAIAMYVDDVTKA